MCTDPAEPRAETSRRDALRIFQAGVAAVDPAAGVRRVLRRDDRCLTAGPKDGWQVPVCDIENVYIAGFGKAAYPMARAVLEVLGDDVTGGVVIAKRGHREGLSLDPLVVREAGHPEPDRDGLAASAELAALLRQAGGRDLVVALISGGGSALFCQPARQIPLGALRDVNRGLLGCGAPIQEINAVRKHLSAVKGGHSARLAAPARVLALVLSDVVGDDLATIASGPFVPDPTTFADARAVLRSRGLWEDLPAVVRDHITGGCAGQFSETPKPADPAFSRVDSFFCGDNATALAFAQAEAQRLGYAVHLVTAPITGDVRSAAAHLVGLADGYRAADNRPVCILAGGETTVRLGPNPGQGGRNQELALLVACRIKERRGLTFLTAGTDGNDGPTDAAGAVVDGTTVGRARAIARSPEEALARHDAYPFLAALGALVKTGPTNTNVMDLQVIIRTPE